MFNRIQSNRGSTLVEVIISIALLFLITSVFIKILNDSIILRHKSDLQAQANAIAASQIEQLKSRDEKPAAEDQTTSIQDFTVRTKITEVTDTLALSDAKAAQADLVTYGTLLYTLEIGTNLHLINGANGVESTISLKGLENGNLFVNVNHVLGSPDLISTSLNFRTDTGDQSVPLGQFLKTEATLKYFKTTCLPELKDKVNIAVNDETRTLLQFAIYNDYKDLITVEAVGDNTKVRTVDNLSDDLASSELKAHYYEVLVTVSKGGTEYARLFTTWAVEGD